MILGMRCPAPPNNRLPPSFATLTPVNHGSPGASRAGNLERYWTSAERSGSVSAGPGMDEDAARKESGGNPMPGRASDSFAEDCARRSRRRVQRWSVVPKRAPEGSEYLCSDDRVSHVGGCPVQTAPQGCSKSSSFAGGAGFGYQNRRDEAARFTRRRPRTAYSRKKPLRIRRRPARRRTTRVLAGESGSRRHPITNSCRLRSLCSLRPT